MSSQGAQLNTFTDSSGRITTAVFMHRGSPPQAHWKEEGITVGDQEMLAVGGGGVAAEFPEGALLTASHPNEDLTGWVVSSKDHQRSNPHELVTYVIGIKIAGMTRDQLRDAIQVVPADSGLAPHPESEAGINSNTHVLLGGGFKVEWFGNGNLATASFPSTRASWKARSKDHRVPDAANLRVFAIGLRRNLPVGTVVDTEPVRSDGGQSPHPSATAGIPPGFVLTGGGAEVHFSGAGNLLWKLQPSNSQDPSFTAASKDHITPDPCTITTYALGIRLL
ncbi:hypothetical protein GCM10027176_65070 [Actinoallomurus bryophytorum]|uniref:Uncharacterized protein n=2 Tax=Actinoallomurus bryophytorum TaxID=1490222 RepID=A0A543CDG2_9ACTN|nr:hypothetical protein FB559_0628 [Actinoallomurus bryophytorum]